MINIQKLIIRVKNFEFVLKIGIVRIFSSTFRRFFNDFCNAQEALYPFLASPTFWYDIPDISHI